MPRQKQLSSMPVKALVKLRDQISAVLNSRASALKKELAELGTHAELNRGALHRTNGPTSPLAGRKVAPKYRGPGGQTWAGRGAQPLWMREALKAGKKPEQFLIAKSRASDCPEEADGKEAKSSQGRLIPPFTYGSKGVAFLLLHADPNRSKHEAFPQSIRHRT
jgi:DNA-binding protein H-NS